MAATAIRLNPSIKGGKVGKPRKKLTAKEAREKGETGAFARHLAKLLADRELDHRSFADACQRAGLDVPEKNVRAWLRGDQMPRAHLLRDLGKVLKLADPRHILPE